MPGGLARPVRSRQTEGMRLRNAFIAAIGAAVLASAAATPARAQASPPPTGAEAVVTPERRKPEEVLEGAATRPLRDLNLIKPKIAPDLEEIMARPYAIGGLRTCRQLNDEARRMTALVGPDVDDPSLAQKDGASPAERLLDSAEGLTGSLIPGQGIIRELTGAKKAARHTAAARLAGQLRRAHVRGVMKARGCRYTPPPAAAGKPG